MRCSISWRIAVQVLTGVVSGGSDSCLFHGLSRRRQGMPALVMSAACFIWSSMAMCAPMSRPTSDFFRFPPP